MRKTRYLIESPFDGILRSFSGRRFIYRGLDKTHTLNTIETMGYNLKCMPRLLVLQEPMNTKSSTLWIIAHKIGGNKEDITDKKRPQAAKQTIQENRGDEAIDCVMGSINHMRPLHGLQNDKFSLSFCEILQNAVIARH